MIVPRALSEIHFYAARDAHAANSREFGITESLTLIPRAFYLSFCPSCYRYIYIYERVHIGCREEGERGITGHTGLVRPIDRWMMCVHHIVDEMKTQAFVRGIRGIS